MNSARFEKSTTARRLSLAAIFLAGLTGCATVQITPQNRHLCGPMPSDEAAEKAVKSWVDSFLKDPFSAQVRNITVLEPTGWQVQGVLRSGEPYAYGWKIAFEVNARNGFGAYTGWQRRTLLLTPGGKVFGGTVQGAG